MPSRRSFRFDLLWACGLSLACLSTAQGVPWEKAAPEPPLSVAARSGVGHARIEWEPSPSTNVSGYQVYRSGTLLNTESVVDALDYQDFTTDTGPFAYTVEAVDESGAASVASAEVTAQPGILTITLPDFAVQPGDEVRIPVALQNATGVSPNGMRFNISYSQRLVDSASRMSVQAAALLHQAELSVTSTEPGRIQVTTGADAILPPLQGDGLLFHIFMRIRSDAVVGTCGTVRFTEDVPGPSGNQPGVQLLDEQQSPVLVTYDDPAFLCVPFGATMALPEGAGSDCAMAQDDWNGDGVVDASDLSDALWAAVQLDAVDDCRKEAGDINGDLRNDGADTLLLSRKLAGFSLNPPSVGDEVVTDESYTLQVEAANVFAGSTVEVPVVLTNIKGVGGIELALAYPPEMLLLDVLPGALTVAFDMQACATNGLSRVVMTRSTAFSSGQGSVALFRFQVRPEVALDTPLNIVLAKGLLFGEHGERLSWNNTVARASAVLTVVGAESNPASGVASVEDCDTSLAVLVPEQEPAVNLGIDALQEDLLALFSFADADLNDQLSLEEAQDSVPYLSQTAFQSLDANGDNTLSQVEVGGTAPIQEGEGTNEGEPTSEGEPADEGEANNEGEGGGGAPVGTCFSAKKAATDDLAVGGWLCVLTGLASMLITRGKFR
jgi:hypothetical protein